MRLNIHFNANFKWPCVIINYGHREYKLCLKPILWHYSGYQYVTKHLARNLSNYFNWQHDDVIKWKHFPRYWPFVRGIHRFPGTSPHKGQWRGTLMFSVICVWINGWVNNREAGDWRRYCAHYDVTVMSGPSLNRWFRCFVCFVKFGTDGFHSYPLGLYTIPLR